MCRPHCANLMRRFASQAGQTNVSPPRLHVLILLTGLAGSMQVLASTQQAKADSGLRVAALSSLRIFLQTTAAGAGRREGAASVGAGVRRVHRPAGGSPRARAAGAGCDAAAEAGRHPGTSFKQSLLVQPANFAGLSTGPQHVWN